LVKPTLEYSGFRNAVRQMLSSNSVA